MPRRLPPLRALQAFEAVARLHSVTEAAGELAVTPSAISHRLRNLELHLGMQLFHRAKRRIALSDAGREYLLSIGSAFDRIERASERIAGGMATDVLTVHCSPSFAPAWLLPRIGTFMQQFPQIDLRIHATPQPVDFFRTDTDLEIRYGNADWAGLVVTQLMQDTLTPLCSPEIRAALGPKVEPDALRNHPLIVSERAPIGWEEWFKRQGRLAGSFRGLRFDRGYLALEAAAYGHGIALESTVFAARYLAEGRLVRVIPAKTADIVIGAHSLVYPPVFADVQKIRSFRDWITGEADAYQSE